MQANLYDQHKCEFHRHRTEKTDDLRTGLAECGIARDRAPANKLQDSLWHHQCRCLSGGSDTASLSTGMCRLSDVDGQGSCNILSLGIMSGFQSP